MEPCGCRPEGEGQNQVRLSPSTGFLVAHSRFVRLPAKPSAGCWACPPRRTWNTSPTTVRLPSSPSTLPYFYSSGMPCRLDAGPIQLPRACRGPHAPAMTRSVLRVLPWTLCVALVTGVILGFCVSDSASALGLSQGQLQLQKITLLLDSTGS